MRYECKYCSTEYEVNTVYSIMLDCHVCPFCGSSMVMDKTKKIKSVEFIKLHEDAKPFAYHNTNYNDACMDIHALQDCVLSEGETHIIPTGIAIKIPEGYEGRVIGRSGLSSKGVLVHHGVIDENYTGEIGIIITNMTCDYLRIKAKDRIAQFSIHKVHRIIMKEVAILQETSRGNNGFGSSDSCFEVSPFIRG